MIEIRPIHYNFSTVEDISLNQLQQHYKLYEGYVDKLNAIWNTTKNSMFFSNSNTSYSKMRSLKLGETFVLNGVKLHELYFENICGNKGHPSKSLLELINKTYISYENFLDYFKNVALSMRGWVILSIDSLDNSLHIIGSDAHDIGAVWNSYPLLVMDVYEHAYMIDFGIDRKKYIDTFIKNINWDVVNMRFTNYFQPMKNTNPLRSFNPYTLIPSWRFENNL